MLQRSLLATACLLALAGCADAPGVKKPLPLDYREQTQAETIYRKVGPKMAGYDGVISTYLTSSNNPRRIVCVVKDKNTRTAMKQIFGGDAEGLKIRYEIAEKGFEKDDGPIEAVPTEEMPTTLWGKFMFYMKNFAYRVLPGDDKPEAAPKAPVADPKTLKST